MIGQQPLIFRKTRIRSEREGFFLQLRDRPFLMTTSVSLWRQSTRRGHKPLIWTFKPNAGMNAWSSFITTARVIFWSNQILKRSPWSNFSNNISVSPGCISELCVRRKQMLKLIMKISKSIYFFTNKSLYILMNNENFKRIAESFQFHIFWKYRLTIWNKHLKRV